MSQIWLRCLIGDPESGEIIDRWDDQPLPETLEIKHLRSYLMQRFGEPLETDVGDSKGVTFRAPRGSGPKGAVLFVIPLMRDLDSGEIFSIFKRLDQLASLAGGLGAGGGVDLPQFDLDEPWVGPKFDPAHLRQATNDLAARAMRAWVIAAGLAAEIEGIRAEQAKVPPAPGLATIRESVNRAAKRAAAAADPAWGLGEKVMKHMHNADATGSLNAGTVKTIHKTENQLIAANTKTLESAREAERAMRRLAQLGFGVSALLGGSARIERLDRTCVAVLHPPDGYGTAVPLLHDGVSLAARSREDLVVEVAGIVCRLLIDRGTKARFEVPGPAGGWFEFSVEPGDTLVASLKATSRKSKAAEKLKKTGKPQRGKEPLARSQRWPSPVKVHEPAKLAVDTLFDAFGLERPRQLVVTVEPAPPVTPVPDEQTSQGPPGLLM
jgi:hypothetical protein